MMYFKQAFLVLGVALWLLPAAMLQGQNPSLTPSRQTFLEVEIGIIGAASDDILKAAIQTVKSEGLTGLVIALDTPGGTLETTRSMVKEVLAAPFPIIVWVGPAGSRAGSAGAFLTLAAHVAAMAPGTNIGAAHPVNAVGTDMGEEMERKVTNDAVAFMESIARTRGRNVEMARSFVSTSVSVTAEEAMENKVIDVVAKDLDELFASVDGRVVEVDGGIKTTLLTGAATRIAYEKSPRQKLLELLSNPNLFYLLFMVGLIGLGYEFTHPGLLLPGVVGGICLILALIATSVLPVSYGAAALILFGVALMVAEAFVSSFGALGIGGIVAFVIGSIFLVDPANEAGLRISWLVIAPGAVTIAVAFVGLGFLVLKSERSPVRSGREALIGEHGIALEDFEGAVGQVRIQGAIWSAVVVNGEQVRRGETLTVTDVKGLELRVIKRA